MREISRFAYGFKASKALPVAIDLEIFSRLSGGAKSLAALADEPDLAENRLCNGTCGNLISEGQRSGAILDE